jgi:hypothetical protein
MREPAQVLGHLLWTPGSKISTISMETTAVSRDLLEVMRSELAAMVRVERVRNATHRPVRVAFVPDRLPQCQRRLDARGRVQTQRVRANRYPGFARQACTTSAAGL